MHRYGVMLNYEGAWCYMHISGRTGKGAFGGAECSNHEINRE